MCVPLSSVQLFVTPWTVACQTSLEILQARILQSLAPSPGDLTDPGIESRSSALQADSLPSEPLGKLELGY